MGELEDKEFELLLAEKRHKEIIGIMNKMLEMLSKEISANDIQLDTSGIEKAISMLKMKPDDSIPNSIKKMTEVLSKKLDTLKQEEKPNEWVFTIKRSPTGLIETVRAKTN